MILAQAADPNVLWSQLAAVITNWRVGAHLLALVISVHLLVTLSKVPSISQHINAAWRPVIAVALGVLGAVLSAIASGSDFQTALSMGIPAGIAAAGGSVVLHEAAQSVRMGWAWLTRNRPPAALVALLAIGMAGTARADATIAMSPSKPVVQVLPEVAPSDPLPAAAPTPSKFGGCVGPWTCFQPSVVITPMAINLRTKTVEAAFEPGLGYGVTFHGGQWYSFGIDVYFNVDPGAQRAAIAVMGKAVNGYLRFGWSKGFVGDSNATAPRLLFGFGTDL